MIGFIDAYRCCLVGEPLCRVLQVPHPRTMQRTTACPGQGGSGRGDSYDNALAESVSGLYKT